MERHEILKTKQQKEALMDAIESLGTSIALIEEVRDSVKFEDDPQQLLLPLTMNIMIAVNNAIKKLMPFTEEKILTKV